MKTREFIALLHNLAFHDDVREFEVQAYDADDERWREVTGVVVNHQRKTILIHTDEL